MNCSSGLGNVIEEFLVQKLPFPLAPTTAVISNTMEFNADGQLESFSEPLLHMFNKNIAVIPEPMQSLIPQATCGLLLGDGVGDLTMAEGAVIGCLLKIGWLNEKVDERLQQYVDGFDVVVTHDGGVPDACFNAVACATSGGA